MKRKLIVKIVSIVLAIAMPIVTATTVFVGTASAEESGSSQQNSSETAYESPDINKLTGHGEEPEELSVSAGATYQEKAWYEYVQYSEKAVSSYRINDGIRLLFYDPYTYTNSMVMDVDFDATTTEFDTMSSYTVSHTTEKSIEACVSSTYTNSTATQTSGRDKTHSEVKNTGETKTIYNHSIDNETSGTVKNDKSYDYVKKDTLYSEQTIGSEIGTKETLGTTGGGVELSAVIIGSDVFKHDIAWLTDKETNTTTYSNDYKTSTKYVGDDTVEYNTTSTTDGWTELSARVTKTVGSSSSTSSSWSEMVGTTISKTYAATHFATDGVTPLPWAIVHYRVQMPMKCCYQVKYSGEWITTSTIYCLLTTVQGTCRAWMQNGQVYYEDWGNGEPVVATDFWSQFMTREQLINAYKDKLYPTGGED